MLYLLTGAHYKGALQARSIKWQPADKWFHDPSRESQIGISRTMLNTGMEGISTDRKGVEYVSTGGAKESSEDSG